MKAQRRLRRFFSERPILSQGQRILIPAAEARHFQKTLRLKPGDSLLLTDEGGQEAVAAIETYETDGSAWVGIVGLSTAHSGRQGPLIRLFIAFAAKGVMDDLVGKCQELGVDEFRPVVTERTVVLLSNEKEEKVLERWYKIVRQAAKQSANTRLMAVFKPEKMQAAMAELEPDGEAVFFHPEVSEPLGWGVWLGAIQSKKNVEDLRLNLFIGPEGGFSENEIRKARQAAQAQGLCFSQVNLGPHILRVPTAVIAAVSTARLLLALAPTNVSLSFEGLCSRNKRKC